MAALKFVDSHNMVAFLEKPAESDGFEQIVDFLNAHTIKYALTVNPTIYTSCIEQFWATAKVKTVNGKEQLQALVDRKKVIITESTIRRDLQLKDAESIECLPNATIFEELTRMGAKTIGDMSHHKRINVTPSHTKKIFENMKREGKGLSGTVTPLFPTMMVQAEGFSSRMKWVSVPSDNIVEEAANEENVPIHSNDPLVSGEDRLKLNKLMKLYTQLQNRVLGQENTKTTQALQITSLKREVQKMARGKRVKNTYDEASLGDQEDASKQGRKIHDINEDEDIYLVNVPRYEDMFGVNDLEGDEVVVESDVVAKKKADEVNTVEEVVSTAGDDALVSAAIITTVELTLAQTLAELKSDKPKAVTTAATTTTTTTATTVTPASTRPRAKGIIFHDQEQAPAPTPIAPLQQLSKVQDKGKGKMVEEEPEKSTKKKDQIRLDEELAFKIQAE
ncbi:hypothetical protein Tco_0539726 [Tanacetum coccineum]